jgi:hypothetical protein
MPVFVRRIKNGRARRVIRKMLKTNPNLSVAKLKRVISNSGLPNHF